MYLCSGRETVSVRKLKSHPKIVFVSDNPPSAFNLSSATIFSRGIGSFGLMGHAATSIARGIAAAILSLENVTMRKMIGMTIRKTHQVMVRRTIKTSGWKLSLKTSAQPVACWK